MIANIVGNGISRKNLDLHSLTEVWGCNALYRDFTPYALVVVDRNMQQEVVNAGYHENNLCYFGAQRRGDVIEHPNVIRFEQNITSPNNAGVSALYFAIKSRKYTEYYLFGFDLETKQSNIYAGTSNYKDHKRNPPKLRRGIPEKIAEFSKRHKIIRVIDPNISLPHPGITDITYEQYYSLSNQK